MDLLLNVTRESVWKSYRGHGTTNADPLNSFLDFAYAQKKNLLHMTYRYARYATE